MDVQYPYAEGIARLRLMYRLPLPTGQLSLLELVSLEDTPRLWPDTGRRQRIHDFLGSEAPPTKGLDAIALPGIWGAHTALPAGPVLAAAHRALRPGGVVVGHFANPLALCSLLSVGGWRRLLRAALGGGQPASAGACLRALQAAGFESLNCSFVQPSIDDPMGLIPIDFIAARAQFLRAIRSERGHFSPLAYAARIGLSQVGLGGMQQAHLFFWGRKAC